MTAGDRVDGPSGWTLLAGTTLLAAVIHLLHEASHMLAAIALGASGTMGTNTVRYTTEMSDTASLITNAAGPGLMLVFAGIAFVSHWRWAPSVLFIVFFQRAMAAVISALAAPNDEARMGVLLEVGPWAIFALTVGLTGLLFLLRARSDKLGWKWIGISWVGFNIAITAMVFGDGVLPRIAF